MYNVVLSDHEDGGSGMMNVEQQTLFPELGRRHPKWDYDLE